MKNAAKGIVIALCCAVVFGMWPACTRAVYADGANPSFAILVTTAARALTLYFFCLATRKPVFATRADTKLALRGGFFQTVGLVTMIAALVYLPGPIALTIGFTHTIMLLFFMAWRGEAKLDALTVVTTLAALGGLTFVLNLWSAGGHADPAGIALAFVSALATMSRLYVFGQMTKTRNPAIVGAETFLVALMFVVLLSFFQPPHPPATLAGWGWIALGSLSLAGGTFGMFYAIALIGSFRFSLFLKMEPVFTSLFAVLFIGETLGWTQYAGIVMVVGSLAAYQYMEHGKKPA